MKNSKIILILILILLVVFFTINFLKFNNLFSRAQENKKQVNILQQRAENIIEFKKSQNILDQKIEEIQTMFIDLKVPIEFINFLEQTAENNNLIFKITPQIVRKEEKDEWPSLRLQINLKGSFLDFSQFLQEVEIAPYFLDILSITIYREKELEQEIEASLLIKIFGKQ
ncbi:MAG: type 4a pilus biogenesis protein PilO [Candidatus Pacebacteria bacterium]|nr:type 4a pilus biogenesis protein PilO [Candidatus Paceibacterota bacterium]